MCYYWTFTSLVHIHPPPTAVNLYLNFPWHFAVFIFFFVWFGCSREIDSLPEFLPKENLSIDKDLVIFDATIYILFPAFICDGGHVERFYIG